MPPYNSDLYAVRFLKDLSFLGPPIPFFDRFHPCVLLSRSATEKLESDGARDTGKVMVPVAQWLVRWATDREVSGSNPACQQE